MQYGWRARTRGASLLGGILLVGMLGSAATALFSERDRVADTAAAAVSTPPPKPAATTNTTGNKKPGDVLNTDGLWDGSCYQGRLRVLSLQSVVASAAGETDSEDFKKKLKQKTKSYICGHSDWTNDDDSKEYFISTDDIGSDITTLIGEDDDLLFPADNLKSKKTGSNNSKKEQGNSYTGLQCDDSQITNLSKKTKTTYSRLCDLENSSECVQEKGLIKQNPDDCFTSLVDNNGKEICNFHLDPAGDGKAKRDEGQEKVCAEKLKEYAKKHPNEFLSPDASYEQFLGENGEFSALPPSETGISVREDAKKYAQMAKDEPDKLKAEQKSLQEELGKLGSNCPDDSDCALKKHDIERKLEQINSALKDSGRISDTGGNTRNGNGDGAGRGTGAGGPGAQKCPPDDEECEEEGPGEQQQQQQGGGGGGGGSTMGGDDKQNDQLKKSLCEQNGTMVYQNGTCMPRPGGGQGGGGNGLGNLGSLLPLLSAMNQNKNNNQQHSCPQPPPPPAPSSCPNGQWMPTYSNFVSNNNNSNSLTQNPLLLSSLLSSGNGYGGGYSNNSNSLLTPLLFSNLANQNSAPTNSSCITNWQCIPSYAVQCGQQPAQPDPSTCPNGTIRAVYGGANNSCITSWSCSPTTTNPTTPTAPTATISCNPNTVDIGGTTTIAYSCSSGTPTPTGFSLASTGSSTVVTITDLPAGVNSQSFSLKCVDGNTSSKSASCTVQVAKPSIIFTANPSTATSSIRSSLGWVTTGMRSCIVSSPDLPQFTSDNASITSPSGAVMTPLLSSTTRFTLQCSTIGGSSRSAQTSVVIQ